MKIIFLYLLIALSILLILTILTSCRDGNSSNEGTFSGSVALYITDSPDEDYAQVELQGYNGINYLAHEIAQEG